MVEKLLDHLSPLGREHIGLTGDSHVFCASQLDEGRLRHRTLMNVPASKKAAPPRRATPGKALRLRSFFQAAFKQ